MSTFLWPCLNFCRLILASIIDWTDVTYFQTASLVTRMYNPWLLLATLPLSHPVQALKMTPLLQFTPVHFVKSTPLPLLTTVCNFEALLGASLISMNQQVLLRPGTPVL